MRTNPQESMAKERIEALNTLRALLEAIGSANDAEDHGYCDDATRMRIDSCQAIRELMAEQVFLRELFPSLQWELDSQHILGFGWSNLCDEIEKAESV
jgi:hypothetical protein